MNFVDLFSGCGGLSAGLMTAGIELTLAVEKSEMAAETFHYNLVGRERIPWEEFQSLDARRQSTYGLVVDEVKNVLREQSILRKLKKQKVSVLVGGPPCQGFSSSGKRDRKDARNSMSRFFLRFINELQPRFIVVENVHGMRASFDGPGGDSEFTELAWKIHSRNYVVQPAELDAAAYGVPQTRKRVFLFCVHAGIAPLIGIEDTGEVLDLYRAAVRNGTIYHSESHGKKLHPYEASKWQLPPLIPCPHGKILTAGPELEKIEKTAARSSLKNHNLRNHSDRTAQRFALYRFLFHNRISSNLLYLLTIDPHMRKKEIIARLGFVPGKLRLKVLQVPLGGRLVREEKFDDFGQLLAWLRKPATLKKFGTKKRRQRVIDPDLPSPTIMTIPDDLVHPTENRTLSVREVATLQGFNKSFHFKGLETTGGHRRKLIVPQYSQVGNAVPPPLARAIGRHLLELNSRLPQKFRS